MASAVLAFIDAGLLILSGALLLFGASVAASIADSLGDSSSSYTAEFAFDGVLDLVAGGLLIAGGVNLLGGRLIGRTLLTVGGAIVLVEGIYWPARFDASTVPSIHRLGRRVLDAGRAAAGVHLGAHRDPVVDRQGREPPTALRSAARPEVSPRLSHPTTIGTGNRICMTIHTAPSTAASSMAR